ncbi:MAG TPA: hypothetical protein VLS96_17600 [Nodosilinea sp.]|nr:hypothetical protein [Nodosilinea sp.]
MAYGSRTLTILEDALLDIEPHGKLIFTGHRGCGKSTLLNQLAINMDKQGLFVSFLSMVDVVEMSAVNRINILYSIALKLMEQAVTSEVSIPDTVQEALTTWFTQTKTCTHTDKFRQEIGLGGDFFKLFTAFRNRVAWLGCQDVGHGSRNLVSLSRHPAPYTLLSHRQSLRMPVVGLPRLFQKWSKHSENLRFRNIYAFPSPANSLRRRDRPDLCQ